MEQRIGFIGLGNMGSTILKGILANNVVPTSQCYVYDNDINVTKEQHQLPGVNYLDSSREVAKESDIVIIAVHADNLNEVLNDIQKELKKNTMVVSIASGVTIKTITKSIGYEQKIIRVTLNTPAMVGSGMCSITPNTEVTDEELQIVQSLFNCIGKTEIVFENQIDGVMGVSGSSSAFVALFIEALADGAVKSGLPREQAYTFAAQSVLGSAKYLLETGAHPAELKDMVCSSTSTAIDGVQVLEDKGFRSAVINAVIASVHKSQQLTRE